MVFTRVDANGPSAGSLMVFTEIISRGRTISGPPNAWSPCHSRNVPPSHTEVRNELPTHAAMTQTIPANITTLASTASKFSSTATRGSSTNCGSAIRRVTT